MGRSMDGPFSSFKRSRRSPPLSSKFASRFKSSSGTKQIRKDKFADFDDAPVIPSGHAKRTFPNHGTGGAKTSEFMYFKKLSGAAAQKAISKQQSVEAQESDKISVSISNKGEKEPPVDFGRSISSCREQLNGEPSCSGLYDTPICKLPKECTYPALKITPLAQESLFLSPEASRNSNAECENGRVFSNKRRNLIKLAAKTLSVGVDDFFLRRSDFIRELVQRLGNKKQPETKKGISSSCLETAMEKHTHLGHRVKLENLASHASNLPTLPSIEAGMESNTRSGWPIQEPESSESYPDFSTCFHYKKHRDTTNNLLPFSPCHDLNPYSFGSGDQDQSLVHYTCFQSPADNFQSFHDKKPRDISYYLLPFSPCHDMTPYSFGNGVQDQSLVPYACFQNPVDNFQSPADKFSSELISWDVKEKEEKHQHLPLALYNPASFYDEAEELVGDEFFGSFPRKMVSALAWNSSYVCETNNFFSNNVDANFGVENEQSLLLVKENSVNRILEIGCDLPLLDP